MCKPQEDLAKLAKQLQGRKASIGVKKLLGLIDMVSAVDVEEWSFLKIASIKTNHKPWNSQEVSTSDCPQVKQMEPRARVNKLMCKLEDEQFIDLVA